MSKRNERIGSVEKSLPEEEHHPGVNEHVERIHPEKARGHDRVSDQRLEDHRRPGDRRRRGRDPRIARETQAHRELEVLGVDEREKVERRKDDDERREDDDERREDDERERPPAAQTRRRGVGQRLRPGRGQRLRLQRGFEAVDEALGGVERSGVLSHQRSPPGAQPGQPGPPELRLGCRPKSARSFSFEKAPRPNCRRQKMRPMKVRLPTDPTISSIGSS